MYALIKQRACSSGHSSSDESSCAIVSSAQGTRTERFSGKSSRYRDSLKPEEFVRLFHRDRVRQDRLEEAGHRSPKWEVLRSLQQGYGARKVRGCTINDAPSLLNRRDERSGNHGRKLTGEVRGSPPPRDSETTTTGRR